MDSNLIRLAYHSEDEWKINGQLKVDLVEKIVLAKELACLDMPDYDVIFNEITPFRLDIMDMCSEVRNWDEARRTDTFDMSKNSEWRNHGPASKVRQRAALNFDSMINPEHFPMAFWLNHKTHNVPAYIDNSTLIPKAEKGKTEAEQLPIKRAKRKKTTKPSAVDRFKKTHRIK